VQVRWWLFPKNDSSRGLTTKGVFILAALFASEVIFLSYLL
jgi:hypothetical protein